MKATELRIGNWINIYDDFNSKVTGMTNTNKAWFVKNPHDDDCAFNVNQIKPIPLTEEWLVKFGYEKDNGDFGNWHLKEYNIFTKNGYAIGIKESKFYWYFGACDDFYSWVQEIKHVHQFQNLYFALKGEELKITK